MIPITSKNLGLTAFITIAAIMVTTVSAKTCAECKSEYDNNREKNCQVANIYSTCVDAKTCSNETAKQQAYQEANQVCATECNRCASTYNYAKPQDCKAAETYVQCTNQSCKDTRDKESAMNAKQTQCQSQSSTSGGSQPPPNGNSQPPSEQTPPPPPPKGESTPPPINEQQGGETMPPKEGHDPSMGHSSPPPGEYPKDSSPPPKDGQTMPPKDPSMGHSSPPPSGSEQHPKGSSPPPSGENQQPGASGQPKPSQTTPKDLSAGATDKCSMCKQTYSSGKQDCTSATTYSECAKANCVGDRSGDATVAANIKKATCDCETCKNNYDSSQKLCNDAKTYSMCACSEDEKRTATTQKDSTCSSECTSCKDTYEKGDKNCQSAEIYANCAHQNCPKDKADMASNEKSQLCKDQGGNMSPPTTMKSKEGQQPAGGEGNKPPTTTMKNEGGQQDQNSGKESQQTQNGDGSKPSTTTMNSNGDQKAAGEPVTAKQTEQSEDTCPSLDACVRSFISSINNGFVYTNTICSGIRTAMKCFNGLASGQCSSYNPYSQISYTFVDLLAVFTHYCTDTERAQTSCNQFETCFSTIKTPEDINSYTDAGYWCAVLDSTMKCGMENKNETGCAQLEPSTEGLAKIQDYCPNAFDVRSGKYIYNDGNIVRSSIMALVLTMMAVIKNWL